MAIVIRDSMEGPFSVFGLILTDNGPLNIQSRNCIKKINFICIDFADFYTDLSC